MTVISIANRKADKFQYGFDSAPRCRKNTSCISNWKTAITVTNIIIANGENHCCVTAPKAKTVSAMERIKPMI